MTWLVVTGTTLAVLLLGVTLLVGYGADWLALRFRVPDVLWLIALGIVVGPVLGLLAPGPFLVFAPTFGVATLILILFDAGLDLRLRDVRPLVGAATAVALGSYLGSTLLLVAVAWLFVFPGQVVLSIVFGTALGCTSGAVVIPLAARLGLPDGLRSVVQLESAIEDALAVVAVTTVLALLGTSHGALAVRLTAALLLPFPVGIAVGLAAGLGWLVVVYDWSDRPFAALATLGFVFVVYAAAEALGGSGILAALVTGGVLGNGTAARGLLRRSRPYRLSEEMRRVQVEIAFVLRAFFLFLVGLFVTLENPGLPVDLAVVGMIAGLFAVRMGVARASAGGPAIAAAWTRPIAALCGRGLTSAVLLLAAVERIPSAERLLLPALLVIVGTNVAMTALLGWLRAPTGADARARETERRWAALAPQLVAFDPGTRPPLPLGRPASPPDGADRGSDGTPPRP